MCGYILKKEEKASLKSGLFSNPKNIGLILSRERKMKEPLNKGTDEKFIPRVRWSEIDLYVPLKLIITNWKKLKIAHYGRGDFLLVPAMMEYNKKQVELCVPYVKFTKEVSGLSIRQQKSIITGKSCIHLVKSYKYDNFGMKITKIEKLNDC